MKSDTELLHRTARGDEEAFLTLYRRHQGPVFRFALHMSGKVEVAEEIVQEVFLMLLSTSTRFAEQQGSLEGYLLGAARNLVRNRLRHERRFTDAIPQLAAESYVVDDLTREESLGELRTAILALPPNYREAVVLCDLEGLDYQTAADHLSIPVGTVRSRLHRARTILTAKLRNQIGCAV